MIRDCNLRDHWAPTFSPVEFDPTRASVFCDGFLPAVPSKFQTLAAWIVPFSIFQAMLSAIRDSAPGPDGYSYGFPELWYALSRLWLGLLRFAINAHPPLNIPTTPWTN